MREDREREVGEAHLHEEAVVVLEDGAIVLEEGGGGRRC